MRAADLWESIEAAAYNGTLRAKIAAYRGLVNPEKVVNVAAVPHRSPFRYPGGKTWLVPYIRQWLSSFPNRPDELAEPFAGGGIVGLSAVFENLVESVVFVEMDEDVGSVWETMLNGNGARLAAKISLFDVSLDSVRTVLSRTPNKTIDRAFATIVRNRVQRGGIMAPGASLMKKGENGRGLRSRWYAETLAKRILDISERHDRISFIAGDGLEFLRYNAHRTDTVFFIDPPYTVAGRRLYRYSEIDHEALFRIVASLKGDFLMTYDNVPGIRSLAIQFGFDTHAVPMKNTHHEIMRELLIGRSLEWAKATQASKVVLESSSQTSLALSVALR